MPKHYDVIHPKCNMRVLSHYEIEQLRNVGSETYEVVRRCCYAVLSAGNRTDDYLVLKEEYDLFHVEVQQEDRGIVLKLTNPPESAFVDGQVIRGVREQLFAVLRDVLYAHESVLQKHRFDLSNGDDITNAVFHLLRNANALRADIIPNLAVCWGGHSIPLVEYQYSKDVGYQLGLRGLDIGTGCGPGAMKGPMKGATIGHAKQHIRDGRYIGITEPSIIATEAPNPIVNELIILPDIEKRLEAFMRLAHGIVIFPGGPGTAEEILYLLGVLSHPDNQNIPFPVIITGPSSAEEYLYEIDKFIGLALGKKARKRYQIIIDDPEAVAKSMKEGIVRVYEYRKQRNDAYFFNWGLTIDPVFQTPFGHSHEAMAALDLSLDQPQHKLAANLRRAFSGIVAGNVKENGILSVQKYGPFQLHGDSEILAGMDVLLSTMVKHGRMRMSGPYTPCYEIVHKKKTDALV